MKFEFWFTSPISDTGLRMIYSSRSVKMAKRKFRKEWGKKYKITDVFEIKKKK